MKIPIRNLFYLMLYAWDRLKEAELTDATVDESTSLVDLFARVLSSGVDHLVKRGVDRGYVTTRRSLAGIRGKIDIPATVRTNQLSVARAVCEYDELMHNVLHNQIVRTTLRRLLQTRELDSEVRDRTTRSYRHLEGVDCIRLDGRAFRSVQLHRNIRFYGFLLLVCRVLYDNLIVDEKSGEANFRDFTRDEKAMAALFEEFVRNFYKREQTVFAVKSDKFKWQRTTGSTNALDLLPRMKTDITLSAANRTIIIDTKFYSEPLQRHFGKATLHSGHLYQLFCYLRNVEALRDSAIPPEGILLYPTVSEAFDAEYEVHGHRVRACTIDLSQEWTAIHRDLLQLIGGEVDGSMAA